ncbi:MAG: AMP-binding protein [Chloroflexi bacterium]|nr:AMP-binding protein [Chloroflexota bacterium]
MIRISPLQDWIHKKIGSPLDPYIRADLESYQLEKLQQVLQSARAKSPFYRELLINRPVTPKTLSALADFPFTKAADIQQDPNRFVCVSQEEIQRIVTLPTSGTTGPAKRIFFTASDQELTIDFFKVGMSTLAVKGDRVLILLPGKRPGSVGDLLKLALERLECIPFLYGPVDEEETVLGKILDQKINLLVGAPDHLHRLACWDRAFGILPTGQIQKVLSSTDSLSRSILTNLQHQWHCEVFDHYGMTETGLGGGVECEAHQGFHLREADLLYEIIDPQTGDPMPDGEQGEVVVTTLTRRAMPLIRYRTGDLSRLIPGICACGSFIKRLDKIKNRLGAGFHLSTGMVYPSDLDEALFSLDGLLDFNARLDEDEGHVVLSIAPRWIRENPRQDKILLKALLTLQAIRQGVEDQTLQVRITPWSGSLVTNPGQMIKRAILNHRK